MPCYGTPPTVWKSPPTTRPSSCGSTARGVSSAAPHTACHARPSNSGDVATGAIVQRALLRGARAGHRGAEQPPGAAGASQRVARHVGGDDLVGERRVAHEQAAARAQRQRPERGPRTGRGRVAGHVFDRQRADRREVAAHEQVRVGRRDARTHGERVDDAVDGRDAAPAATAPGRQRRRRHAAGSREHAADVELVGVDGERLHEVAADAGADRRPRRAVPARDPRGRQAIDVREVAADVQVALEHGHRLHCGVPGRGAGRGPEHLPSRAGPALHDVVGSDDELPGVHGQAARVADPAADRRPPAAVERRDRTTRRAAGREPSADGQLRRRGTGSIGIPPGDAGYLAARRRDRVAGAPLQVALLGHRGERQREHRGQRGSETGERNRQHRSPRARGPRRRCRCDAPTAPT